jgi:TRAP transporter TAXI family solute receptor
MRRGQGGRRVLTATVLAAQIAAFGCSSAPAVPAETRLVILTAPQGAVFYPLGEALARVFTARIPGLRAEARITPGAVFNMRALQHGEAELGFALGGPAYSAFREGTPGDARPHTALRAIAVLHASALQITVRRDGPIRGIRDLRGLRVGMSPKGSGTEVAARIVLEAHGLHSGSVVEEFVTFQEAADRLIRGELDAYFVMGGIPASAITFADDAIGIRLLPIAPGVIHWIRERHSLYRPVVVPPKTYASLDLEVVTLGEDNLLVCRKDLDEELVRRLTEVLFESVPELARAHTPAAGIDVDAASAAPIPLHPGAARYYRERELFR